jgi:RNA polymerase sigma-70 factor (ECF subfamily)
MNAGAALAERRADFETIYEHHSREVRARAFTHWSNAEIAQEITHEAFLRLWQLWQAGKTIQNPRAWLLCVARNLAGDHARSAFCRNGTCPTASLEDIADTRPLPLDHLEQEERCARLREALSELPRIDREILTLHYFLDRSPSEVARHLAIEAGAVHMRLTRARQRLARRLQAHSERGGDDAG